MDLRLSSRNEVIQSRGSMIGNDPWLAFLPVYENRGKLHTRKQSVQVQRIRPSLSLNFVVSEILDDLCVCFICRVVLNDIISVIFPVALVEGPETMSQTVHYRSDEGLIWMIVKHGFKSIYVKRSLNTYVILQILKSALNIRIIDKMRRRRSEWLGRLSSKCRRREERRRGRFFPNKSPFIARNFK
jgi:hypothetical protein